MNKASHYIIVAGLCTLLWGVLDLSNAQAAVLYLIGIMFVIIGDSDEP